MSNKNPYLISKEDQLLRQAYPPTMENRTQVTIEKVCGFELFNTRPYHNYETWSDGYRANDGYYKVEAEDLDDCVRLLCELKTGKTAVQPWNFVKQEDRQAFLDAKKDSKNEIRD